MPYVPPVTFLTNATIDASDFNQNHEVARVFVNQDIEDVDLGSDINTDNIAVGEFNSIDTTFLFETGEHAGFNRTAKELVLSERSYHSGTLKPDNMFTDVRYLTLPNMGRQVYFPTDGIAIISFTAHVRDFVEFGPTGTATRAYVTGDSTVSSVTATNSVFKIAVDGDVLNIRSWYSFAEDIEETSYLLGAGAIAGQASIIAGSQVASAQSTRKFISGQLMLGDTLGAPLTKGWHTFQLVVDSRNEIGSIIQSTFNVETFSFGGHNPALPGQLQYQFKLSRDAF